MLGAALLLKEREAELPGRVRILFQPAEETGRETRTLIDRGMLDGVDTVFAIHVAPDLPTGKICILPGPCMAGVDDFSIRLTSPGGHGATPHLGSDTLLAGAHLAVNLQQIVSREIDPPAETGCPYHRNLPGRHKGQSAGSGSCIIRKYPFL